MGVRNYHRTLAGVAFASIWLLTGCMQSGTSGTPGTNQMTSGLTQDNGQSSSNAETQVSGQNAGPGAVTGSLDQPSDNSTTAAQGESGTSPNTFSAAAANSNSNAKSPFPNIVSMAMSHLEPDVLRGAEAPTMFPVDASGSTVLFFRTDQSTTPITGVPPYEATYQVTFSHNRNDLASYSGTRYTSAADALSGLLSIVNLNSDSGDGEVGLSYNHQAVWTKSDNSLWWTEGRWHIRVTQSGGTQAPVNTANQIVNYLEKNFMPVPHDAGMIWVDDKGDSMDVGVAWQEGTEVYEVSTNESCLKPIDTALAMAIAMKAYSGNS